jgi:hypothetical protein
MTIAEAISLLQTMPPDALFCVHRGEGIGTIDPAESIYLVPVEAQGPVFSDEDDTATPVVVVE